MARIVNRKLAAERLIFKTTGHYDNTLTSQQDTLEELRGQASETLRVAHGFGSPSWSSESRNSASWELKCIDPPDTNRQILVT